MPPLQPPPMAFFQRAGGHPYLQRLSKLYSDAKQSYDLAKVTPAGANVNDDADVKQLRKDFQFQQDRLLAWGMHWADVEAQHQQGQDVDIDKKIDQAGLGEVVAEIMSQIKSLLDQSGRLQHPEKYEMARMGISPQNSPNLKRKEWSAHEVQTGRTLLEQLKTCIDVLYSMTQTREPQEKGEKSAMGDKKGRGLEDDVEAALYGRKVASAPAFQGLRDHPLHIDFSHIDFNEAGSSSADPPPYEAAEQTASTQNRCIGYHRGENNPVLVDFLGPDIPPHVIGTADDIFELHELGQTLTKQRKQLSWCGHLRLLGFTVDSSDPRCGMVYELPPALGYQSLQRHKTLASAITATYNQESTQPALEDRFRLAYNIVLSVLGYFSNGDSHRYLNTSNILLIGKDSQGRPTPASMLTKPDVRSPYLLQSCQDFTTKVKTDEPFTTTIYRHPTHDVSQSESVVPACDIYSLGLILLEIGFWIPLSKLWKGKYDRRMFMERLQRVYSPKLASKCGSKYMKVVQKCLHAPAELLGRGRPEEAAAHLIEVAKELRLCCALDEDGVPPSSDIEYFELLVIEQMCKNESFPTEPPQPSTLPPLKIPGAFTEEQETGVMRSGMSAVKRRGTQEKSAQDTLPVQPQQRRPSKRRQKSGSTLHKWPEMPIPQEDLDQWNSLLMPKLSKILQEALQDSPESCSVSLMKIGQTPEAAKTTICIQCNNTARVNEVLRKRFKPKKGWGVVILKGDVRRSGTRRPRKPRRSGGRRGVKPREQKYQEKPSCGASIGAFRDNEHLPPVSFGGTILVDGEPFGMTVHHMLDTPSESEDSDSSEDEIEQPFRSSAPRTSQPRLGNEAEFSFMASEDDLRHFSDLEISDDSLSDGDDSDSDASTIKPDYSITDDEGNEFWFLDDSSETSAPDLVEDHSDDEDDRSSSSSDDEDDNASVGDKPAILPYSNECEDLTVTQPAIDDVDEDFFPSVEDKDEDHLDSHTFGFVHASSGIRRVMRGAIKHEVDWALIRIDDDRLDPCNTLAHGATDLRASRGGGSRRGRQQRLPSTSNKAMVATPTLTKITPQSTLSAKMVSCRARSSGFSSGRISQAMCLVKLHGRHTFSYSWCVDSSPTPAGSSTSARVSNTRPTPSRPHTSAHARQTAKGGDLGIPGDSGAWVYCADSGELCGHVLAYGEKMRQCYIAPMEVMFEDIKSRLGAASVSLPGEAPPVPHADVGVPADTNVMAAATVSGSMRLKDGMSEKEKEVFREDSGVDMTGDMREEAHRERVREAALERGLRELRIGEQPTTGRPAGNYAGSRPGSSGGAGMGKGKEVEVKVSPMATAAGGGVGGRA